MPPVISIIVAIAENNVIGANNQLIWHISDDLKRFKALTTDHHIIMGRKTFESIGKPLPKRTNIIVSRNPNYKIEGCIVVPSLEAAIEVSASEAEVFIIGGGELYRQAMPLAKKLYLTRVHKVFEGDTFFPKIDLKDWKILSREGVKSDEKSGIEYEFVNFEKK
jgi:dihydrofolate reductase